jgi:hypothetical protein
MNREVQAQLVLRERKLNLNVAKIIEDITPTLPSPLRGGGLGGEGMEGGERNVECL